MNYRRIVYIFLISYVLLGITIGFVVEMDSVMENRPGYIDIFVSVMNNGILESSITVSYVTFESSASNAATSK